MGDYESVFSNKSDSASSLDAFVSSLDAFVSSLAILDKSCTTVF
jgi:hypothetical protein